MENLTKTTLTAEQDEAAELIAKANLKCGQIAEQLGVHSNTLYAWRKTPEFIARVAEYRAEIREEACRVGIADKYKRIENLDSVWKDLKRLKSERADDPNLREIPGGTTGLLVRNIKSVGFGENTQIVETFEIDTALAKLMIEYQKNAAQELGEWTETKIDVGDKPLRVSVEFPEDEADRMRATFGIASEPPKMIESDARPPSAEASQEGVSGL